LSSKLLKIGAKAGRFDAMSANDRVPPIAVTAFLAHPVGIPDLCREACYPAHSMS
jgi:hypothetical protein